jgi:hypothetical protein
VSLKAIALSLNDLIGKFTANVDNNLRLRKYLPEYLIFVLLIQPE